MNVNEVPQDERDLKHDGRINKLMYAVDKDGKYTGINSAGWEAENFALEQAWEDIDEALVKVEAQVKAGALSPIVYFMQKNLMDIALLANYSGKWQWQVKRHFKPSVFKSLSPEMLGKYARIFNVTVDELVNFGKDKGKS
ncbi:MAG: hypothetical protein K0Q79_2306 [Flavipsychrobacter sp.]|jgi:hypothetical protein|nr:hypothetical protein [Flavipsychrobacter sp.]